MSIGPVPQIHEFVETVLGHEVEPHEIDEVLELFDHNKDGQICKEEVRHHVVNTRPAAK